MIRRLRRRRPVLLNAGDVRAAVSCGHCYSPRDVRCTVPHGAGRAFVEWTHITRTDDYHRSVKHA